MNLEPSPQPSCPARPAAILLLGAFLAGCATDPAPRAGAPESDPPSGTRTAEAAAPLAAPAAELTFESAPPELRELWAGPVPTELFPVLRVVDGDTLHVERAGETVKLRLLSVDTEEKLSGRSNVDPLKPETRFGQQTTDWAADFFARHATVDGQQQVGLRFPDGEELLDVYGRLLCHVVLADGADYNVALVALGKSPYFNKYGNSRIAHDAFVAAQEAAARRNLGIWNAGTNRDVPLGETPVVRPYERLLPWWQLRADAMDAFRAARAVSPAAWITADEPDALAAAERSGDEVQVFCAIDRWFDEDDGSLTLLMRSGARDAALRAKIAAGALERFDRIELKATATEPFIQNFLVLRGRVERDARGFALQLEDPAQIRPATARP